MTTNASSGIRFERMSPRIVTALGPVNGERAGSKLAAAERHDVERWDEEQFVAFLSEHGLMPS